jgi:uncharacterized alpha-E superfamily protein
MISRVAEHCFWLSRYLERSENTARILEVNQTMLLDFEVPLEQQWKPLLIINGIHDFTKSAEAEDVQDHLTWDRSNLSSIVSSMAGARENGRVIREVISADMWERLNYYHLWLQGEVSKALYKHHRHEFYNQIKRINPLITGIGEGTMSHGEAWEFFQLGKHLERACQTARILDVKYHILLNVPEQIGTPIDNAQWVAILTSCSGYEPYHKSPAGFTGDVGISVADFLIYDPLFPRSVRRCLHECQQAAHAISGRPLADRSNDVEIALGDLIVWLESRTIDDLVREGLHEALTRVVNEIHHIGDAIHRVYFDAGIQVPVAPKMTQSQSQSSSQVSNSAAAES